MLIEEFEWDADNAEKVTGHGVSMAEINTILEARYVILRNKRNRAGSHRIIGRTAGGRLITVVGLPDVGGVWRPINAWPSDSEEQAHARKNRI